MMVIDGFKRDIGLFNIPKLQTVLESYHEVLLLAHVEFYGEGFRVVDVLYGKVRSKLNFEYLLSLVFFLLKILSFFWLLFAQNSNCYLPAASIKSTPNPSGSLTTSVLYCFARSNWFTQFPPCHRISALSIDRLYYGRDTVSHSVLLWLLVPARELVLLVYSILCGWMCCSLR